MVYCYRQAKPLLFAKEDIMRILTPAAIESVAWEGELILPEIFMSSEPPPPPAVTLGKPEIWPAAEALEPEVGKKWTPPLGDASYWLVRLACTLRDPAGRPNLTEATQTLYLRPKNATAGERAAYAYSLFPDRLSVEDKAEFSASLGPELKFVSGFEIKPGEIGATVEYRKVFPVIQSYGAGESTPYWVFKSHAAHPLDGNQFVYAVIAATSGAGGVRASVELTATIQTELGPVRLGLPEKAHANLGFGLAVSS
jgi:hypothetical protein